MIRMTSPALWGVRGSSSGGRGDIGGVLRFSDKEHKSLDSPPTTVVSSMAKEADRVGRRCCQDDGATRRVLRYLNMRRIAGFTCLSY